MLEELMSSSTGGETHVLEIKNNLEREESPQEGKEEKS